MSEDHTYSVLVVDDAVGIVEIYERWLRDDYDVLTASDGEAALAAVDESVDVVLVDWNVPRMGGESVVQGIHDRGLDPGIVILSSVGPEREDVDVEYHAWMIKPILREELVEAIARAVDGKSTQVRDPGKTPVANEKGDGGELDDEPPAGEAAIDGVGDSMPSTGTEELTNRISSIRENLEDTADDIHERSESIIDGERPDLDGDSAEETEDVASGDPGESRDETESGEDGTGTGDGREEEPAGPDEESDDDWREAETLTERVERIASRTIELTEQATAENERIDDETPEEGSDGTDGGESTGGENAETESS